MISRRTLIKMGLASMTLSVFQPAAATRLQQGADNDRSLSYTLNDAATAQDADQLCVYVVATDGTAVVLGAETVTADGTGYALFDEPPREVLTLTVAGVSQPDLDLTSYG